MDWLISRGRGCPENSEFSGWDGHELRRAVAVVEGVVTERALEAADGSVLRVEMRDGVPHAYIC